MNHPGLPPGLLRRTPGIYQLDSRPDRLVGRLAAAGWRTAVLSGVADRAAVLRGIGRALGFPDYYGANLDALWDCLSDLTEPTALVWHGWQHFAAERPEDWARVWTVLKEGTGLPSGFALILVP